MERWSTFTPDGRRLLVRREREHWVAQCGKGRTAHSDVLDVALIEAIRADQEVVATRRPAEYAAWVRELADSLTRSSS